MLKYQQQFRTMLRRIDDGEFLVKELSVALESYDEATSWLTGVSNGDQDIIDAVIKKHGHEISHEGVSLEGVQVHINSEQVQSIVDFLRKWIPKILTMIRDAVTHFFKWVKQKLNDLEKKIERVRARLRLSVTKEIRLGAEYSDATLSLIDGHSYYLQRVSLLSDALRWVKGIEFDSTVLVNPSSVSSINNFNIFSESVGEWLTLNPKSELFSASQLGWDPHDSSASAIRAVNNLPSISDALSEAEGMLGSRLATQSITKYLTISRDNALKRLDEFDDVQLKLISGCGSIEKALTDTSRNLERFSGQRTGEINAVQAKALNVAVRTSRYALNAATRGLQWRLSQLRKAVDALAMFDPVAA